MNKKDWWIVIGIVIVVAILASLITLGVTGNVIRQNTDVYGKYELYTKQEVDVKLGELYTKKDVDAKLGVLGNVIKTLATTEVLNRFAKCSVGITKLNVTMNCNTACKASGKICVLGITQDTGAVNKLIDCTTNYPGITYTGAAQCLCC